MAQNTQPLQVRIDKDDLEWFRQYAKSNNRTIAQEVRHMIATRRKRVKQ